MRSQALAAAIMRDPVPTSNGNERHTPAKSQSGKSSASGMFPSRADKNAPMRSDYCGSRFSASLMAAIHSA